MSMITELIERLRESADDTELNMECSRACDGECNKLLREAADVIEELSTKLQAANMERSSQYYNGGWIPVSERLPEESIKQIMLGEEHTSDFVLVTIKGQTYPFPKAKVKVARYSYTYKAWQIANNNFGKVVAWMPLPEPYKAESEDKK